MGFEKGRRSRSSHLWLTHDDMAVFSNALEVALPALHWHCIHVGNMPIRHQYTTVEAALNCDLGETNDFLRQAYTMLPFGGRGTLGMLLLNFVGRYPKTIVPERDFGWHHDKSLYPEEFRSVGASALSVLWNINDGNEALCGAMETQVQQVWRILNNVTKPFKCHNVINSVVVSSSRYRIGPQMSETARREGWLIEDGQFFVLD
jgi:hypothetical protein